MGWDGNGTLRWKMGWEMAGLIDVLKNGMENGKNKNGRTLEESKHASQWYCAQASDSLFQPPACAQ